MLVASFKVLVALMNSEDVVVVLVTTSADVVLALPCGESASG